MILRLSCLPGGHSISAELVRVSEGRTEIRLQCLVEHTSLELRPKTSETVKFVLGSICIWGTGFVCFSFWLRVLDKAVYSAFESTLNSSVVSYRIVQAMPPPLQYAE